MCGKEYQLKDEFAGKQVQCPHCNAVVTVPAVQLPDYGHPAFNREKFLLRQKRISISEKYYVLDEKQNTILVVIRPAHVRSNVFAVCTGCLTWIVVFFAAMALSSVLPGSALQALGFGVGVLGAIAAGFVVAILLFQKRHITFYADDTCQEKLLEVLQDQKLEILKSTYTVNDREGNCLAKLRKYYLYNLFRKRWYCLSPDERMLCIAKEDSIILSLLRRFLGSFFGILRTNFIILRPDTEAVIGEFNRKFTLFDRYVLDLTADPARFLDRRVALALGVMLDTGERR